METPITTRIVQLVGGLYAVQEKHRPYGFDNTWKTVSSFHTEHEARAYRKEKYANEIERIIT